MRADAGGAWRRSGRSGCVRDGMLLSEACEEKVVGYLLGAL
jgi:hypothetical protein